MKYCVINDDKGRTHVQWELCGVTANMIDWFWCNVEKCNFGYHSNMVFQWMPEFGIHERGIPLDSVYTMTQDWFDGTEIQSYLRIETLDHVPELLTELIRYDHVTALGGISIFGEDVNADDPAFLWRLHQWQKTDDGVQGMTSAYTKPGYRVDSSQMWANQTIQKLQDWEWYLPDTYRKYMIDLPEKGNVHFSFRITEQMKYCN